MSSALCAAHLKPFMIMFFTSFHVFCGVARPLGVFRCLYCPDGRMNVVIFDDSLSNEIWLRPFAMFFVAKHVADTGMSGLFSAMSSASLFMCLLTGDRSVTRSMLPPGFGTRKA